MKDAWNKLMASELDNFVYLLIAIALSGALAFIPNMPKEAQVMVVTAIGVCITKFKGA